MHGFFLILLFAVVILATAQSRREDLMLDNDWKFSFRHAANAERISTSLLRR
jgi:hypothetical protein